jgi:D-tyrosyl-tRNA(Tyr) deacylase
MRALLQRVRRASVSVDGRVHGKIGHGLLLLMGFLADDNDADAAFVARKVVQLRVFDDADGVMNLAVADAGGALLVVSQFTLYASTRKGNRPSWSRAAPPEIAAPGFAQFVATLQALFGRPVATGVFGAQMQVELVNDGPVTLLIDSRLRE